MARQGGSQHFPRLAEALMACLKGQLKVRRMGEIGQGLGHLLVAQGLCIQLRQQIVYLDRGAEFDPMEYVASAKTGVTARCDGTTEEAGCWWVWYSKGSDGDFAILTVVVE